MTSAPLYEYVRIPRESLARTLNPSDVTSWTQVSPPSTPNIFELGLGNLLDNPEYDQISDRAEVVQDEALFRRDPTAVRAMAEDFSEGKLETIVDSPQKENAGTQTQYVSYQITTKVGIQLQPL
jgi:sorting nexin-4